MAHTMVTLPWVAKEVAQAFVRAWGRRRKPTLCDTLNAGVLGLYVEVVPSDDMHLMRRRAARAGRILADEAMRKRLTAFMAPDGASFTCDRAVVSSKDHGIAIRLTHAFNPMWQQGLYRLDMLGSRHVPAIYSERQRVLTA